MSSDLQLPGQTQAPSTQQLEQELAALNVARTQKQQVADGLGLVHAGLMVVCCDQMADYSFDVVDGFSKDGPTAAELVAAWDNLHTGLDMVLKGYAGTVLTEIAQLDSIEQTIKGMLDKTTRRIRPV